MRLAHWCTAKIGFVSGMVHSIKELLEAELEMGIDAAIIDPDAQAGGVDIELRRKLEKSKPWTWAKEDPNTLNVISSTIPDIFPELPHPVFIAHGMPEYAMYSEMVEHKNSMSTSMELLEICEATICWSKREKEFWEMISDNPVYYLERGVDLKYWVTDGPKVTFRYHPSIVFADVPRPVKNPLNLAVAATEVKKKFFGLKLQILGMDAQFQSCWAFFMGRLHLNSQIETWMINLHTTPGHYYRAADMLVSEVQGGPMSRVAVESLACGCPTIINEGCPEKIATAKFKQNPRSLADTIIKVYEEIQANPDKLKKEARKIAEENYDVCETVRGLVKIGEDLM